MEPPCLSASLPSPDTPRIPEAWFSYLGDWPKQRWGPERAVCTEPSWGKSEAPGSMLPLEFSLSSSANYLRCSAHLPSPRPSPSELLELSVCPYPPCGSPGPIMGTLGRHWALPQAPPVSSPSPCGSPGQSCTQMGGAGPCGPGSSFKPTGCGAEGASFPGARAPRASFPAPSTTPGPSCPHPHFWILPFPEPPSCLV